MRRVEVQVTDEVAEGMVRKLQLVNLHPEAACIAVLLRDRATARAELQQLRGEVVEAEVGLTDSLRASASPTSSQAGQVAKEPQPRAEAVTALMTAEDGTPQSPGLHLGAAATAENVAPKRPPSEPEPKPAADTTAAGSIPGSAPAGGHGQETMPPDGSCFSTTLDPHDGGILRLRRDGDYWYVSDLIGIRYGAGNTIGKALAMWATCVEDTLAEDESKCGEPYLSEVRAYKKAFS